MILATKEWVISLLKKALRIGGNPIGTIINYMGNNAPEGYFICDGAEYNIADYKKFTNYLQREFGSINYFGGDGATTFAVPDLRGEFLRGSGTNSHSNQGNGANVGVHQNATRHIYMGRNVNNGDIFLTNASTITNGGTGHTSDTHDSNIYYSTGRGAYVATRTYNEPAPNLTQFTSRPTNTSVLYCIKY